MFLLLQKKLNVTEPKNIIILKFEFPKFKREQESFTHGGDALSVMKLPVSGQDIITPRTSSIF